MSTTKKSRPIPSALRYELLAEVYEIKAELYRLKAAKARQPQPSAIDMMHAALAEGMLGGKRHS